MIMSMQDGYYYRGNKDLMVRRSFDKPLRVTSDVGESEGMPGALQQFKNECDINRIMAGYAKTGVVEWLQKREGQYLDVTGVDFMEAMDTVVKAREMFDELPSHVREKFRNDPAEFLDFMQNPKNQDEMIDLGLATRKEEPKAPEPTKVIVVSEPAKV